MNAKNNNNNGMNVIENKEKGWQVNAVLPFAEYHNFFIKGKIVISRLADMVCESLRIDREDASTWAKAFAFVLVLLCCLRSVRIAASFYPSLPRLATYIEDVRIDTLRRTND